MSTQMLIFIPDDCERYLETSARIRGVSRTRLIRRLVEIVLHDQLILSILDDGDRPSEQFPPLQKGGRPKQERPPRDKVFTAVKPQPQRPNRMTINIGRPQPKTREQLRRELAEAAANTAAMSVDE